jgi:hypothetical protein
MTSSQIGLQFKVWVTTENASVWVFWKVAASLNSPMGQQIAVFYGGSRVIRSHPYKLHT